MSRKRIVIYTCAALIGLASGGCTPLTKDLIVDYAKKHDAALVITDNGIQSAIKHVTDSKTMAPAEKAPIITELTGASTGVKDAQGVASKLESMAMGQADTIDKLNNSFWSTKQKQIGLVVGGTIALLGVVIVLMRYGGLWGSLAAVPVLGIILGRLGAFKKVTV